MLYIARIEVATGDKFKVDKNGNMPFLAIDLNSNKIHPFGGIINGTVGRRLGLKSGMTIQLSVSSSKNPEGQTNYQHAVTNDLTQAISQELARSVVADMMSGNSSSPSTPVAERTTAKTFTDESEVVSEVVESADPFGA
jgi:hypothetical protein